MKKPPLIFFLLLLVGLASFFLYRSVNILNEKAMLESRQELLPDYQLSALDGQSYTLSDLATKPTVLLYYHPDCDFCQEEGAALQKHNNDFTNYNIILISSATKEKIKTFSESYQLSQRTNFYFLVDEGALFQQYFGIKSLPSIFIYNKNKKLIKHFKGETKIETLLKYLSIYSQMIDTFRSASFLAIRR